MEDPNVIYYDNSESTECDLCGKIFTENRHLKRHIQTVHDGYEEKIDNSEVKIENPRVFSIWNVKSLYEYQYFNCQINTLTLFKILF